MHLQGVFVSVIGYHHAPERYIFLPSGREVVAGMYQVLDAAASMLAELPRPRTTKQIVAKWVHGHVCVICLVMCMFAVFDQGS